MKKRKAFLIGLLFVAVAGGAVVRQVTRPRYSFLSGLAPVFAGDPMPGYLASLPPGFPPPSAVFQQRPYTEIYTESGSFDSWRRKIDQAMEAISVRRQDRMTSVSRSWSIWPAPGKELTVLGPETGRAVILIQNCRATAKMTPMDAVFLAGRDPGWVTILVIEKNGSTFPDRVREWWRTVFG